MTQISELITCLTGEGSMSHWAHQGSATTVCGRVFTEVIASNPQGPACNSCRNLVIYGSVGAAHRRLRNAARRR
jgi:hypothetical protein